MIILERSQEGRFASVIKPKEQYFGTLVVEPLDRREVNKTLPQVLALPKKLKTPQNQSNRYMPGLLLVLPKKFCKEAKLRNARSRNFFFFVRRPAFYLALLLALVCLQQGHKGKARSGYL